MSNYKNFFLNPTALVKSSKTVHFSFIIFSCAYEVAAEQKARTTYDNILRLVDDPDIKDPIKFLRAREVAHFQRFGEALREVQDNLDSKNFYAFNPAYDKKAKNQKNLKNF